MSRTQNILKRAKKKVLSGGKLTEQEFDAFYESYIGGAAQQNIGDAHSLTVEEFLHSQPKNIQESFEDIVRSLYEMRNSSLKRFRTKALGYLMVAYQNGSVEGAEKGKSFDVKALMKKHIDAVVEQFKRDLSA